MGKPFDVTRLRKTTSKKGIRDGFYNPSTWIDTGSYGLNRLISGNFFKGVPLGGVTTFAGESGSGKSYIVSGNIIRAAQAQGIFPVVIDSEDALHEEWMQNLGVDTSEDAIFKVVRTQINDVAETVNDVMDNWKSDNKDKPREEQTPILFVIDSLGFLSTPTQQDQFQKADMKGDLGRKAAQLKALVTQCIGLFSGTQVGMVATNHVYKSQNQFDPDDVISGGSGFVFASQIVVSMNKLKLKEKVEGGDGKKTKVVGIRAKCRVVKSRFAKPFEDIEVEIPYNTGMNPYSGVFDLFKDQGVISKDGNRWRYVALDGTEIKEYEAKYDGPLLDRIMREHQEREAAMPKLKVGVDETPPELLEDEAESEVDGE